MVPSDEQEPLRRSRHLIDRIDQGFHPEAANDDWIRRAIDHFRRREPDLMGRTRYYGYIREAKAYMRVVLEPDGEIVTAFFDEDFTPQGRRSE